MKNILKKLFSPKEFYIKKGYLDLPAGYIMAGGQALQHQASTVIRVTKGP